MTQSAVPADLHKRRVISHVCRGRFRLGATRARARLLGRISESAHKIGATKSARISLKNRTGSTGREQSVWAARPRVWGGGCATGARGTAGLRHCGSRQAGRGRWRVTAWGREHCRPAAPGALRAGCRLRAAALPWRPAQLTTEQTAEQASRSSYSIQFQGGGQRSGPGTQPCTHASLLASYLFIDHY
jgi:hypothetical protein